MAMLATLLLATVMDMVLAMALMDMESAMLMLSQRLMPMLSTVLMEDMVLDTALILWDMVMAILATLLLATAVDMVLAMAVMGMESAMPMLMLSQSLMLSMEPMVWCGCVEHLEQRRSDGTLHVPCVVLAKGQCFHPWGCFEQVDRRSRQFHQLSRCERGQLRSHEEHRR